MIFLGIDCGTQSTRVIALDWESGEILASGGRTHGFLEGLPEGVMEQDPAWRVDAADAGMREVLAALGPRGKEIAGIGRLSFIRHKKCLLLTYYRKLS